MTKWINGYRPLLEILEGYLNEGEKKLTQEHALLVKLKNELYLYFQQNVERHAVNEDLIELQKVR